MSCISHPGIWGCRCFSMLYDSARPMAIGVHDGICKRNWIIYGRAPDMQVKSLSTSLNLPFFQARSKACFVEMVLSYYLSQINPYGLLFQTSKSINYIFSLQKLRRCIPLVDKYTHLTSPRSVANPARI